MVKALSETKSKMELAAAHHRERNAVQTFPEDAKFIKAKLADSIAKAGQRRVIKSLRDRGEEHGAEYVVPMGIPTLPDQSLS